LELLTIKQASEWATEHLGKGVSESNISYLIQYGCVKKIGENESTILDLFSGIGTTMVQSCELDMHARN